MLNHARSLGLIALLASALVAMPAAAQFGGNFGPSNQRPMRSAGKSATAAGANRNVTRTSAVEEIAPEAGSLQATLAPAPAADNAAEPELLSSPRGAPPGYFGNAPAGPGGGCCAGPCDGCCSGQCCGWCEPRFYAEVDYVVFWIEGDHVPPLVTTSPNGTSLVQAGILGQDNTTILFGNGDLNDDVRSGVRTQLGFWLTPCVALEGDYLFVGEDSDGFDRSSTGNPILARPFFNAQTGVDSANVVAFPGQRTGRVIVEPSNDFTAAGIRFRHRLSCEQTCCGRVRVDGLIGYRFLELDDDLTFTTTSTNTGSTQTALGTVTDVHEAFRTRNEFHGADFGFVTSFQGCRWSLDLLGRLALGDMQRTVIIDGTTRVTAPGQTSVNSTGGLLAQRTNIGTFKDDEFTVIPELGATLGYCLSPCWKIVFGYHFIRLDNVVRAGDQIDTTLNLSQSSGGTLVGDRRPAFVLHDTSAWAQGMSLGLECKF